MFTDKFVECTVQLTATQQKQQQHQQFYTLFIYTYLYTQVHMYFTTIYYVVLVVLYKLFDAKWSFFYVQSVSKYSFIMLKAKSWISTKIVNFESSYLWFKGKFKKNLVYKFAKHKLWKLVRIKMFKDLVDLARIWGNCLKIGPFLHWYQMIYFWFLQSYWKFLLDERQAY